MPKFSANYPHHEDSLLLSTPERLGVATSYTGKGVVIAFLDAGFYMHNDIRQRVLLHVDATTDRIREEREILNVDVTSWHGLMVSTIGAGNGFTSGGRYTSLAPRSKMVLIKVSNPRMQVKEADILRGFEWLIKWHKKYNIRIINVSVGGDVVSNNPNHPLHRSVELLASAGVTVIISAGNHGTQVIVPPASAPSAIVVGGYNDNNSSNPDEWNAYHSNYGYAYDGSSKPDIIAPAEWIPSPILPETMVSKEARWLGQLLHDADGSNLQQLLKSGYRDLNIKKQLANNPTPELYSDLQYRIYAHKIINKYHQFVDGTSVAAPIVSSVVAQMLEANPSLTPMQIKEILKDTAQPLGNISDLQQGAGAIQVNLAVATAENYRN